MTINRTIRRPNAVSTQNVRRYGGPYYKFGKPPPRPSFWGPLWKRFWSSVWEGIVWLFKAMWVTIKVIWAIGYVICLMLVIDDIVSGTSRRR